MSLCAFVCVNGWLHRNHLSKQLRVWSLNTCLFKCRTVDVGFQQKLEAVTKHLLYNLLPVCSSTLRFRKSSRSTVKETSNQPSEAFECEGINTPD